MTASATRRRSFTCRVGAACLTLVAAGALSARLVAAHADSSTYVGGGFNVICSTPGQVADGVPVEQPGVGVGGACFNVPAGATAATVSATDDLGRQPAIAVNGHYPGNTTTPSTVFCEGFGTWAIPPGVDFVGVTTLDPVTSGCSNPTRPLKGTVDVSFS
jgi:hypothetical protein